MDEIKECVDRVMTAKERLRQAEIDLTRYLAGTGGGGIRAYKAMYEQVWNQVHDGSQPPLDRVFESECRGSYKRLAALEIETGPFRVEQKRLKALISSAKAAVKTAEYNLKSARRDAGRKRRPAVQTAQTPAQARLF